MKPLFFIILIFSILLYGCTDNTIGNESVTHSDTQKPFEQLVPTPQEGLGVIFGKLTFHDGMPISDAVFLSRNLTYNNPDLPPTVSFSFQYSPRAAVDPETGFFYFTDVEPAENYVITIMTGPSEIISIKADDFDYPLTISVQADETIDLGVLQVELP